MMNKNKKPYSESINKEFMHVTWEPTWEPEELKNMLPTLTVSRTLTRARVDEPDLFLPTADQALGRGHTQIFSLFFYFHFRVKKICGHTRFFSLLSENISLSE